MSEMGEIYGAMRDMRRHLRAKYGTPCPDCVRKLPKASPTILLPQQRCRIHGYRDPLPESLMDGEYEVQS